MLAIIAFHTGLNSVPGGYYGVDAFSVLSDFLITSLLVKQWGSSGSIRLRRFWAGRARRLLPALFLLVTVMGIVMAFFPTLLEAPHMLGYALATDFYGSNWYSTHTSATYFSLSPGQSPLLHAWSLAIKEQFYLIWPLMVLAVLKLGRGRLYARRYGGVHSRHAGHRRARGRRARQERSIEILGGGCMCSSAWRASVPRRPHSRWCSSRPTVIRRAGTTARIAGPRRCSSAWPSPSG